MASKIEDEILNYLTSHKIMQLFDNLASCLFHDKPDDPKEYLITQLENIIRVRDNTAEEEEESEETKSKSPTRVGLFDIQDAVAMFEMLDATRASYINLEKYKHGMNSMGVKEFNPTPDGYDTDKIVINTFLREAECALDKQYAAFKIPRSEAEYFSSISEYPVLKEKIPYDIFDEFEGEFETENEIEEDIEN